MYHSNVLPHVCWVDDEVKRSSSRGEGDGRIEGQDDLDVETEREDRDRGGDGAGTSKFIAQPTHNQSFRPQSGQSIDFRGTTRRAPFDFDTIDARQALGLSAVRLYSPTPRDEVLDFNTSATDNTAHNSRRHSKDSLSYIPPSDHKPSQQQRHSIYGQGHGSLKKKDSAHHKPTYRMFPLPSEEVHLGRMLRLVSRVSQVQLDSFAEYKGQFTPGDMIRAISDNVIHSAKLQNIHRHKLVCHVSAVQLKGQGVQVADRCLWDLKTDTSAVVTHHRGDFVFVIALYMLYNE